MKGKNTWHYRPYSRLTENYKKTNPYICRLAPYDNHCDVEWFDNGSKDAHTLCCRQRASDKSSINIPLDTEGCVTVGGLKANIEYEVFVRRDSDGNKSDTRLFRSGEILGTVVNYLHPKDNAFSFSGKYLCSPCIIKAPSGRLLISMDVYGVRTSQNLSFLYKSDDGGKTWQYLNDLFPCFWGKLFVYNEKVHMLAMSSEYGNLLVGCSDDEGETWSAPVSLFPGCGIRDEKGMHQAPTPVLHHGGRIWTAVDYGTWEMDGHASALVSIDENDDLFVPENWSCSEFVPFNRSWEGAVPHAKWGCHEGNAVAGPDGEVYNTLRYQISNVFTSDDYHGQITHGKAMLLKSDKNDPEKALEFVKFIDFNGGMSKFVVRYDEVSKKYVSLVNEVIDNTSPGQRNVLSLAVSEDLENWAIVKKLIDGSDYSPDVVGFQYVDFIIDADNILFASRTAFNGANNFHDSNYTTFHIEKDFRKLF